VEVKALVVGAHVAVNEFDDLVLGKLSALAALQLAAFTLTFFTLFLALFFLLLLVILLLFVTFRVVGLAGGLGVTVVVVLFAGLAVFLDLVRQVLRDGREVSTNISDEGHLLVTALVLAVFGLADVEQDEVLVGDDGTFSSHGGKGSVFDDLVVLDGHGSTGVELDAVLSSDLEGLLLFHLTLGSSVVRLGASHEDGLVYQTILKTAVDFGTANLLSFGNANYGGKSESNELHD